MKKQQELLKFAPGISTGIDFFGKISDQLKFRICFIGQRAIFNSEVHDAPAGTSEGETGWLIDLGLFQAALSVAGGEWGVSKRGEVSEVFLSSKFVDIAT
jgi:hypothetical protein